jgi:hypothetical protein
MARNLILSYGIENEVYHFVVVLALDVIKVINWTQDLDPVFKKNYERDPLLSWQYFGSSSGITRQYPGM